MKLRHCELCNAEATVFCPSDAAFLCWTCDRKVHGANFLVARHVRQSVCSHCKNLTGDVISGGGFHPFPSTCASCVPTSAAAGGDLDSLSSSSGDSSACISSTTSPTKEHSGGARGLDSSSSVTSKRQRASDSRADIFKAEGIFVNWIGKLGVGGDAAVQMACRAQRPCLDGWTKILPFRVSLAASMWLGLRLSPGKSAAAATRQTLKHLEEISGVPAKIILVAESKLERALRAGKQKQQQRRLELEEGWAEC